MEFRMKMAERFENDERTMNVLWTITERMVSERWTLCERWTWAQAERRIVNGEQTVGERWTHSKRTMSERKNGKVESFRDCTYKIRILHVLNYKP